MVQAIQDTSIKRKSKRVILEGEIIKLYCVDQESPQSIARMCEVSIGTVYYCLKARGVKLRGKQKKHSSNNKKPSREPKYVTEVLEYLYNYLDLTVSEISVLFQTTKRNIEKILQRRGIKKCSKSS